MTERIPKNPPHIAKWNGLLPRPLFSVMIPTYNCISYIETCINSVLAQDLGEQLMQIEVVDDYSTDGDVKALVERVGKGRVKFYRQEENRGSLRNFETCINRADGELVHILHGDDYILPGFYTEIKSLFDEFPDAGAAFTNSVHINVQNEVTWHMEQLLESNGLLPNWLDRIAQQQLILTPSIVIKRSVYEHLGGFCLVHYGEDWHMWVRIAANYPVAYTPKVLAHYRVHDSNISAQYFSSGKIITDIDLVIKDMQKYIPAHKRRRLYNGAKQTFSKYFSTLSDRIYHDFKRPDVALTFVKYGLNMHRNFFTVYHYLKIRFKLLIGYKI